MAQHAQGIRLTTDRLILRPHRPEDHAASYAMWSNPIVARYTIGTPSTLEQAWARLLIYRGHWEWLGYGYWVIEEKASGEFVGEVGFADFKRVVEPPIHGIPEMGWVLNPAHHGKGYGTEAVRAALTWGQTNLQASRTVCMIDTPNLASIRLAERCGFHSPLRTTYKGNEVLLFERGLD